MRLIIEGTTAEIIKILQGLERSVGEKTGEACRETYIPSIAQNTDPKELFIHGTTAVSYTHLDVYKRQVHHHACHGAGRICAE